MTLTGRGAAQRAQAVQDWQPWLLRVALLSRPGDELMFVGPRRLHRCFWVAPFEEGFGRFEIRNTVCNWGKVLFSHLRKLYQLFLNQSPDCTE